MDFLHDIGKASQGVQDYIKSAVGLINPDEDDYVDAAWKKGKDRSFYRRSAIALSKLLLAKGRRLFVAQVLSLCIASHHSRTGLLDCISPEGVDAYSKRMAKIDEKTHINEVLGKISDDVKSKITDFAPIGRVVAKCCESMQGIEKRA